MVAPAQPVYPPPSWLPPLCPGLGLIPGGNAPHWDISLDVLWLERDTGRGVFLGRSFGYGPTADDQLWSDDVLFPLTPGIRLQLVGQITDGMAIEATCWGLQHWSIGRTMDADPGYTLLTSPFLNGASAFDNSLGYTYTSDVANVELNQRFKLFSFDPYRALSWLWGVRYFYLSDDLILSGSDLYTGTYENLSWQTKNNLIGMQVGLQWTWGWDRFQLSTEGKVGLFANVYSQQGTDSINGSASSPGFDVSHSGTDLSALFEFSFLPVSG